MATGKDGLAPEILHDEHFRRLIGANTHEGVEYFSKEGLDDTLKALAVPAARRTELLTAAQKAGYRTQQFAAELKPAAALKSGAKQDRTSSTHAAPKARSTRAAKPSAKRKSDQ